MNLVKVANLLKSASDQSLAQELQNPSGSVPSYMVLSELDRRKKLRGSIMNNEPQGSVAEDMEAEAARANQMGIGSMDPYAQQPQEQQAPQGYAGGGEVRHFYGGAEVDYGGGYESDPNQNTFWPSWGDIKKRTGYGRMLPQAPEVPVVPQTTQTPATQTPATQTSAAQTPAAKAPPQPSASRAPVAIPKDTTPQATSFVDNLLKNADADRAEMRNAHKAYTDMLAAQTEEVRKSKNSDIANTLMMMGLGIAGGTSQHAITNIGQGAMPGLQQYMGMERDRQKQLNQLAMAQGQAGIASLKDVQGINKDLATLEYQKQHGKYFEQAGQAAMMNARANAANVGAGKAQANEIRIMALREKALEALGKDPNFQFMKPEQQEAAIQNRMRQLGITAIGGASAQPVVAGTYNPKTGKIE